MNIMPKYNNTVLIYTGICALTTIFLIYCVSSTRSLVLTEATWLSAFSTSILCITVFSNSFMKKNKETFTYGLNRVPVLFVFSSIILVQLSSIFILKESIERFLGAGHHHDSHDASKLYVIASVLLFVVLIIAGYAVPSNPFNHVLASAQSSIVQEYVSDMSKAICYVVPGLSRLLLPRINSLALLAYSTAFFSLLTYWLGSSYEWIDGLSSVLLGFVAFTTMMPLAKYTGRILLQTVPDHVHNQIGRCVSEASRVEGVFELRNLHFWQIDFNNIAGTVDVRIRRDANEQHVLAVVTEKLSSVVHNLNVQILKDVTASWSSAATVNPSAVIPPPLPFQDNGGDNGIIFHH